MYVKKIVLEGFRNYENSIAVFENGINVIIGDNGQGKTNLLESVYYLTTARSFRTRYDSELIGFEKDSARMKADIFSQSRDQKIDIILKRGRKKDIHVNGVRIKKSLELAGKVMAVLFCPEDLTIVKSGASVRRRLMDSAICQMKPKYTAFLSDFNKLYENKARILKDFREKPSLLDALDEFSVAMAQRSAQIIFYRSHFVKKLNEYAGAIHADFSQNTEELALEYRTVRTVKDPFSSPSEIFEELMVHQRELRQTEIDTGLCLSGAHKDDIEININRISARSYASQGQTRTAALSVKLAEREIFYEENGEAPILLLDDVLSELDSKRQDFVLNRIKSGQVLITCCEDGRVTGKTGGKILRIEKGEIR